MAIGWRACASVGDEDSQTGELPREVPAPITIDTADPVIDKVPPAS
jgi:hypothetical protein